MKSIILAFALVAALPGCAPVAKFIGGDSVAIIAPSTVTQAEKSLILAHLAYDGVSISVTALANSGAIRGSTAATVKCWYDRAGNAIRVADTAAMAANTSGVMNAITLAQDAIVQAKAPTASCEAP